MIQSTNSHVRRLLSEKTQYEEELQKAKEIMKGRMQGILIQCKWYLLSYIESSLSIAHVVTLFQVFVSIWSVVTAFTISRFGIHLNLILSSIRFISFLFLFFIWFGIMVEVSSLNYETAFNFFLIMIKVILFCYFCFFLNFDKDFYCDYIKIRFYNK